MLSQKGSLWEHKSETLTWTWLYKFISPDRRGGEQRFWPTTAGKKKRRGGNNMLRTPGRSTVAPRSSFSPGSVEAAVHYSQARQVGIQTKLAEKKGVVQLAGVGFRLFSKSSYWIGEKNRWWKTEECLSWTRSTAQASRREHVTGSTTPAICFVTSSSF